MEVCAQLHTPAALPQAKRPPICTEQEAGWVPQPAGTFGRRIKPRAPAEHDTSVVCPAGHELQYVLK
jgi:hypothetical protein